MAQDLLSSMRSFMNDLKKSTESISQKFNEIENRMKEQEELENKLTESKKNIQKQNAALQLRLAMQQKKIESLLGQIQSNATIKTFRGLTKAQITMIEKQLQMSCQETIYQGSVDGFINKNMNEKINGKEHTIICVIDDEENVIGCYHENALPTVDVNDAEIEAVGMFGDEKHFMFVIQKDKEMKVYKRKNVGYSMWMFASIDNLVSFNGACVIPNECDKKMGLMSGNFEREYGEKFVLEKKEFGIKDIVVLTFQ